MPTRVFVRRADNKVNTGMTRVSFWTVAVLIIGVPLHTIAQSQAAAPSTPLTSGAAAATARTAALNTIQGTALNADNTPLADTAVRLRDARSGRIVNTAATDKAGLFTFRSVEPGSYVVEVLGPEHNVIAASQMLNVNDGDALTAVVKLPFRLQPFAGVLGHTAASAALVIATAAASGVLATQIAGQATSPPG